MDAVVRRVKEIENIPAGVAALLLELGIGFAAPSEVENMLVLLPVAILHIRLRQPGMVVPDVLRA